MYLAFHLPLVIRADSQPSYKRQIMKLAGIVLIIIGVLALVYQGFTYTKTEKDAQIRPD